MQSNDSEKTPIEEEQVPMDGGTSPQTGIGGCTEEAVEKPKEMRINPDTNVPRTVEEGDSVLVRDFKESHSLATSIRQMDDDQMKSKSIYDTFLDIDLKYLTKEVESFSLFSPEDDGLLCEADQTKEKGTHVFKSLFSEIPESELALRLPVGEVSATMEKMENTVVEKLSSVMAKNGVSGNATDESKSVGQKNEENGTNLLKTANNLDKMQG